MFNNDNVVNMRVVGNRVSDIVTRDFSGESDTVQIDLNGALVFPGLINSHDHLDFNLFPKLGNRTYNNYTEWGACIHKDYKDEIAGVLNIPLALRAEWGMYKNLLAGITTVVNHGEQIPIINPLITIFQNSHSLHSVHFEKYWKLKLNNPFNKDLPYAIHVGEGVDELSASEIDEFIQWNLLKKEIVGIHGVAMSNDQAKKFKALIWCPESNLFMLNKTADIKELKHDVTVLFGTDSTLTSSWNIWEHLRSARKTSQLSDSDLFNALTIDAANIWKLNNGKIEEGKDADIVIVNSGKGLTGWEEFYGLNPENILLIIHQGEIRLFDHELYDQLANAGYILSDFYKIYMNGTSKYVNGNLPKLMRDIQKYSPDANFPISSSEISFA